VLEAVDFLDAAETSRRLGCVLAKAGYVDFLIIY
jgi:hypothetical protein